MCLRLRASASRNSVRRRMTVTRCRRNSSSNSLTDNVCGRLATSASRITLNVTCSVEYWKSWLRIDFAVGVALQHDVQPHLPFGRLAVGEVDDPRDPLDAVVPHQVFELFLEPVARFEIGNLGDDDHVGIFLGLEMRRGAQRDRGTPGEIALPNSLAAADDSAGRESRGRASPPAGRRSCSPDRR